jgi:hypothetical protein
MAHYCKFSRWCSEIRVYSCRSSTTDKITFCIRALYECYKYMANALRNPNCALYAVMPQCVGTSRNSMVQSLQRKVSTFSAF